MDPIPSAISALINALQSAAQPGPAAAPVPALLALAGQDVAMLLLGRAAGGGVSLELPSGQVVTAQGQLPYPDGTQLTIRILASGADAPVQLQIQQALPPALPAILAPLVQGEAAGLLAALGQPDPPPQLAPLAELFQFLGGGSPAVQELPDGARIQAALDTLPAQAQAGLKVLLDLPPDASRADLAATLEQWVDAAQEAAASGTAPGAVGQSTAQRTPVQAIIQDLVQRYQAAAYRHPDVPQGDLLAGWVRQLFTAAEPRTAPAGGTPPQAAPPGQGPAAPAAGTPAQVLQTLLGGRAGSAPEAPETWEAWLRTSVKTLADPATAPQGAAFHAAQGKEGTGYFEIPLPWAPEGPLQLWMESERDPRDPDDAQEEAQRVLLGLSFTNLGETRLGIARRGTDLRVRVWTEHPELLQAAQGAMEAELRDLGATVDLRILPLHPGPDGTIPSLRSQVTGSNLQAMG